MPCCYEIPQTLVHDPIKVPKSHGWPFPKIPQTLGITSRLCLNPLGQILLSKEDDECLLQKAPEHYRPLELRRRPPRPAPPDGGRCPGSQWALVSN